MGRGCGEPAGSPTGRPGFWHQVQLFPSTFAIPTVVTGGRVTITICGTIGGPPHITEPLAVSLPVEEPGWHPRAPAPPPPRDRNRHPSGVTTSLHTSPLSPEDGTAPFRPLLPAPAL